MPHSFRPFIHQDWIYSYCSNAAQLFLRSTSSKLHRGENRQARKELRVCSRQHSYKSVVLGDCLMPNQDYLHNDVLSRQTRRGIRVCPRQPSYRFGVLDDCLLPSNNPNGHRAANPPGCLERTKHEATNTAVRSHCCCCRRTVRSYVAVLHWLCLGPVATFTSSTSTLSPKCGCVCKGVTLEFLTFLSPTFHGFQCLYTRPCLPQTFVHNKRGGHCTVHETS